MKSNRKIIFTTLICIVILFLSVFYANNQISLASSLNDSVDIYSPKISTDEAEWSITDVVELGSASGHAYGYYLEADEFGNVHLLWSVHADEIYYKIWFAANQS
ncbi:MAG: hypothetical protein ACTSQF_04850 [Candidatus Heimdallarchaeaceae archaeon]